MLLLSPTGREGQGPSSASPAVNAEAPATHKDAIIANGIVVMNVGSAEG